MHTHTHLRTCKRAPLGKVGLQRMFYFGSSVGFVALLCWQMRKQVANIKRYSGGGDTPTPSHTHTDTCLCTHNFFSCLYTFETIASQLTKMRSAGGSLDRPAKVTRTWRRGFISTRNKVAESAAVIEESIL